MSAVEVFLDETPGEIRGVAARDGRFEHLLIEREDDVAEYRLGARVFTPASRAPSSIWAGRCMAFSRSAAARERGRGRESRSR